MSSHYTSAPWTADSKTCLADTVQLPRALARDFVQVTSLDQEEIAQRQLRQNAQQNEGAGMPRCQFDRSREHIVAFVRMFEIDPAAEPQAMIAPLMAGEQRHRERERSARG